MNNMPVGCITIKTMKNLLSCVGLSACIIG